MIITKIGRKDDAKRVINMIDCCPALVEVMNALDTRLKNGDINNKGAIKMVKGYFDELTFVYFELFRVCKAGANIAFVNDDVRYTGEVIPVDFISTTARKKSISLACGFCVRGEAFCGELAPVKIEYRRASMVHHFAIFIPTATAAIPSAMFTVTFNAAFI